MTLFSRIIEAIIPNLSLQFPVENQSTRTSAANRASLPLEVRNRSVRITHGTPRRWLRMCGVS
jgi:hypothetical protein